MEETTRYLRRAIRQWELLRIAYNIVVFGIIGVLVWGHLPSIKDILIGGPFVFVVINAVYSLGPVLDVALCLFANVRLGAHRYALWWLMTVIPLVKLDWLLRLMQFYALGVFYRG